MKRYDYNLLNSFSSLDEYSDPFPEEETDEKDQLIKFIGMSAFVIMCIVVIWFSV